MKKATILIILLLGLAVKIQAQNNTDRDKFKFGINGGLPVGDASEIAKFSLGLDAAYHYGVSKVFDIGLATGFTNAFLETDDLAVQSNFDNVQFLPVAGLVRVFPHVRSRLNFGADVGYAVGVSEDTDSGFYYRPIVAFNIGRGTEITGSYTGIELDGGTWSTATLGVLFGF
ncbi:hypothetical protein [Allomuricauda sp. d1]|uniref:hypothetical protein n=1 Tax=Allomuricauda sp. d1 TaxID=3136725 RepID=UPI0031E0DB7F